METHDDAGAGQLRDGQIPPGLPTPGVSVVWQRSVIMEDHQNKIHVMIQNQNL